MSHIPTHRKQGPHGPHRGVFAPLAGLTMVAMIGFVGLAVDGGRLYLTKTELQNAADACALAAAYELSNVPSIGAAAFLRADAAATTVATLNKVGFQGTAIAASEVAVQYSPNLDSGYVGSGSATPASAYARCTITKAGIQPLLMQVLNAGNQTVGAFATASLKPSQTNCAVPMAVCVQPGGTAPEFGYVQGNWYGLDLSDTGGNANYTGNFRWVDFNPSAVTPGCSGGGAQELACVMQGGGQCSLPPPIPTGSCSSSGNATPTPGCVGQNGQIGSMEDAYNARFGLYKNSGNPGPTTSPPDYTGYSYDPGNWSLGRNAFAGTDSSGRPNFRSARAAHLPASNVAGVNPDFVNNPYNASTTTVHATQGADRRLVVVPIVDCGSFTGSQHAPVRTYACMLLLDPYRKQGKNVVSRMEYLGLANQLGSPCASSGIAGNASSMGPLVPALVQ